MGPTAPSVGRTSKSRSVAILGRKIALILALALSGRSWCRVLLTPALLALGSLGSRLLPADEPVVLASQLRRWAGLRFASLGRPPPEGSLLFLDTTVPALRYRFTWRCALMQLPGRPSRSPPWSACSLGAPLDAPCGRGRSASAASVWRSSLLCRSAWCRVRLLLPPLSSDEPSCSLRWNTSSLGASLDSPCSRG